MTTAPAVRVFAEHPLKDPADEVTAAVVTPMVKWLGFPGNSADTPAGRADLAKRVAAMPEGRRAISLEWIYAAQLNEGETHYGKRASLLEIARAGRIDPARETARLTELRRELLKVGVAALDLIYCDVEKGQWYWLTDQPKGEKHPHLNTELRRTIVWDDACRRHFGPALAELTRHKIEPPFGSSGWPAYVLELNAHSTAMLTAALRTALTDSGLLTPGTTAVNFCHQATGFPTFDSNGWRLGYGSEQRIDGRTSAQALYFEVGPFRDPPAKLAKDAIWNAFVQHVNQVRSNLCRGAAAPVISPPRPDYAGCGYLHEQLIGHCVRAGVTDFVFWNDGDRNRTTPAHERALADAVIRAQRYARSVPLKLPEIPLDADEVRTGDFVTTYADYLAAKGKETAR